MFQGPVEHLQVVLDPACRSACGGPQLPCNRIFGFGAEHRAWRQPGEGQRRGAQSEQLRAHGHRERGRPGCAFGGGAIESGAVECLDLGATLKVVELLAAQLVDQFLQLSATKVYGNRIYALSINALRRFREQQFWQAGNTCRALCQN